MDNGPEPVDNAEVQLTKVEVQFCQNQSQLTELPASSILTSCGEIFSVICKAALSLSITLFTNTE